MACPKVPYPTATAAQNALAAIRARARTVKLPVAVYQCPGCEAWHLTSRQLTGSWARRFQLK